MNSINPSMLKMEDRCGKKEFNSLPERVFEIPGEPAIVINGVPDPAKTPTTSKGIPGDNNPAPVAYPEQPRRNTGYGEWLEGREVSKHFGDRYYAGYVSEFDRASGWYRVVYEDGDFEDLDWPELREVLQPLDITVPLKSLALKLIKKSRNKPIILGSLSRSGSKKVVQSSKSKARSRRPRGRPCKSNTTS